MKVKKVFEKPSLTKQSFKEECDVNMIMQRFKKNAGVDFLSRYSGLMSGEFGDFSNVTDYRSAIEQVSRASSVFEQLPAQVRSRFENDPALFLDYCQDPSKHDELRSMGLDIKSPNQDASVVPVEKPTDS